MPRYAAIDIGSNSLRMLAAEVAPGAPMKMLAADREVTRLGESVFRAGLIGKEAMELVCSVLARMAQAYKNLDVTAVRVVATAAVRDASNQQEFLSRASQAIGAAVEVISGQEEARLIHLGVQTSWPHPRRRILIVDIGGGSAEIIDSEDQHLRDAFSRPLGAVRLREVFLQSDPPTPRQLQRMQDYVRERLAPVANRLGERKWQRAIGTSATAAAVVSAVCRIPRAQRDAADRLRAGTPQIRRLYRALCLKDVAGRRKIPGIGPRRAEIIIPGTAVLLHVLEEFGFPSLYYSAAGVRDGIIADLAARGAGRELSRLSADQKRAVEQMARRYGVPLAHARKVAALAHEIYTGLQPLHKLPHESGRLLETAAYLHDTGHYVSDTRHHKHSYYLVANSDMPGFTEREREIVANLCRYHRKAMPAAAHPNWQGLSAEEKRTVILLAPLLRLADALDRSQEQRIEQVRCIPQTGAVRIQLVSRADTDLEQWAAERAGETFRQVYNVPVILEKLKS